MVSMNLRTDDSILKVGIGRAELIRRIHSRDSSLDGLIILGVRSTGIYCRPSCHSRRVMDSNIVLFNDCAEAENAGFRPCLRCIPNGNSPEKEKNQLASSVADYIVSHSTEKITLSMLSKRFKKSRFVILRNFRSITGISPREFQEECRIKRVKHSLENGNTVTDSIYSAGYSSHSWVYKHSRTKLGMTPAEYKKGGKGMIIEYLTGECQYGRLIAASTKNGVCFVSIQNSEKELVKALENEFPGADLRKSESQVQVIRKIKDYLDGKDEDMKFDLQGTEFQVKVWGAIRKIPFGETRTYSEIAKNVGRPAAVRAVANACADNPVPLIIPCHRVVRKDGSLGGYGLGIERKKAMLEREKAKRSRN